MGKVSPAGGTRAPLRAAANAPLGIFLIAPQGYFCCAAKVTPATGGDEGAATRGGGFFLYEQKETKNSHKGCRPYVSRWLRPFCWYSY